MRGTDWFLLDLFNDALHAVLFAQCGTVWSLRLITKRNENTGKELCVRCSCACANSKVAPFVIPSCALHLKGPLERQDNTKRYYFKGNLLLYIAASMV